MAYKVKVEIKIVETSDSSVESALDMMDSDAVRFISTKDGETIDGIERAVVDTSYDAMRKALSKHLSELSKKKSSERMTNSSVSIVNPTQYRVDGEAGRYTFETHKVVEGKNVVHDTSHDCFKSLKNGRDHYHTVGFKEIALLGGCVDDSYRKTSDRLNRVRCQQGATPFRTLRDVAEAEGLMLQAHVTELSRAIFEKIGFDKYTGVPPPEFKVKEPLTRLPAQSIADVVGNMDVSAEWRIAMLENIVPYEDTDASTCVSVDDVCVKRQKESRDEGGQECEAGQEEKVRKTVRNTVVHIGRGGKSYLLNGPTIEVTLRFTLAFLIVNRLLGGNIIFFVDGERSLRNGITDCFKWHNKTMIILDWHHLGKKCAEYLSMALKGSKIRNNVLEKLNPLLWHGLLDKAIEYLKSLDASIIKDQSYVEKLIGYFERNRGNIPCYSVRQALGLRNSSNRVEKANDLLVAKRQKNNGMSWSESGSVALASLNGLRFNGEAKEWFKDESIRFKMAA